MKKAIILEYLKACMQDIRQFVGSLVGELADTVTGAMTEIDDTKADKGEAVKLYIIPAGWSSDSTAVYPSYRDISVTGITEKDRVNITVAPDSLGTAVSCGLCPTNETFAGKIRVRARSVPTVPIEAEYWIDKGKG